MTIPLNTVVAKKDGTGSATTTIKGVTVAQLFGEDKERFILLHAKTKKGQGVPPGISCADLDRTSASSDSSNDKTTMVESDLPGSGGSPLLLPLAAMFAAGVLSYAILRRRM